MNASIVSNTGTAAIASNNATGKATGQENVKNITVNNNDSLKAAEDKLIKNLQEQIIKVNENTRLDDESKKIKIADLKNQILEIQERQRQREIEALTKKEEPKKSKPQNNNNVEDSATLEISRHGKSILENSKSLEALKQMDATRTNLKNSASVLRSEINLDSGRGVDTTQKWAKLYKMESNARKLAEDMGDKISDINDKVQHDAVQESEQESKQESKQELEQAVEIDKHSENTF